ncbi:MAG: hypothetical protein H7Y00_11570 [Fimbriimonadaceae bacterium]|nr:hypothetical protein [Chitinophagales bacterium]
MNILREDNVFVGILISVFITSTVFYTLYILNQSLSIGTCESNCLRERFIASMAAFSNFFPFVIYMRSKKDNAMKGVGMITVLLAVFVMLFYYITGHTSILN